MLRKIKSIFTSKLHALRPDLKGTRLLTTTTIYTKNHHTLRTIKNPTRQESSRIHIMAPRSEEAKEFQDALNDSIAKLADVIIRPEATTNDGLDKNFWKNRSRDEASRFATKMQLIDLFTSMNQRVIHCLIHGILPQDVRASSKRWHQHENSIGDSVAGIYVNYIVDQNGNHLTIRDIQEIIKTWRIYLSKNQTSDTLADKIDTLFGSKGPDRRKYAAKGAQSNTHLQFISNLQKRINKQGSVAQLQGGISEVGFSITPQNRIRDHKHHKSSNYLMNAFEACAQYCFPGVYHMEGFIIARVTKPEMASISELALSRLACCYTDNGNGFSHTVAGISVYGVNHIISDVWTNLQAAAEQDNVENEILQQDNNNAAVEQQIIDNINKHNDILDTQIELLEAQLETQEKIKKVLADREVAAKEWAEFMKEVSKAASDSNWLDDLEEI